MRSAAVYVQALTRGRSCIPFYQGEEEEKENEVVVVEEEEEEDSEGDRETCASCQQMQR